MTTKVTVVIPTKNGGKLFAKVLDSVLDQKTPWKYDVIVIDSGSSDNTVKICKKNSRVRLFEIPPNEFGHGKTRNFGIEMANSEYVAFLTQDALPTNEEWLTNLVKCIDMDENIAGAFGKHLAYPNANPYTIRDINKHFEGFNTKNKTYFLEDQKKYDIDEGYRQFLHYFSDNNSVIRKLVWNKIPYPDVDFAEDQIWAKLIIESGYKKAYADTAVVFHSHDYGFIEGLQRSFDESFAFHNLFNYTLVKSLKRGILSWINKSRLDLYYASKSNLYRTDIKSAISSPVHNLMTIIGHYLGSRADKLPSSLRTLLSRDKQVMSGAIMEKRG